MESPRQVFTREQLEESLYGWTSDLGSNAIDVYVHNIRKNYTVMSSKPFAVLAIASIPTWRINLA